MIALAKALRLLDDDELAGLARDLPDAVLAEMLRGLDDAALLVLCRSAVAAATPTPKKTRAPKPVKASPAPASKSNAATPEKSQLSNSDKVLAALRAADGEVSPGDIRSKTGLSQNAVYQALIKLDERGLATPNGLRGTASRWSLKL